MFSFSTRCWYFVVFSLYIISFYFFFSGSPDDGNNDALIEDFHLDGVLAAFPELRRLNNGDQLPLSIDRHRQNRQEVPAQVVRLDQVRQFRDEGYTITSPHLAVYVRNVTAFMNFRRQYARQGFPKRMIRTIFFDDLTIDFPTLHRALEGLAYVQMITFRNVRLQMSSWRHLYDQVSLFLHARRRKIVNFKNCEFLEEVCLVMIEKDPESIIIPTSTHFRRIMANRIPVFFYLQLVREGLLVGMNRSSGE